MTAEQTGTARQNAAGTGVESHGILTDQSRPTGCGDDCAVLMPGSEEDIRLRRRLGWIEVRDRWRARPMPDAPASPPPVMVPRAIVAEAFPDLYFIGCDHGPIKIGVSGDTARRLKTLQTGYPYKLRLLCVVKGGYRLEAAYHERFAAHRLEGEWFERHPEILAEIERLS